MEKRQRETHLNWREYKPTHVRSVDMCAATIFHHRQHAIPVKAIYLRPAFYYEFLGYMEKLVGRELQDGEGISFDSVNIELGENSQSTPLLIELYETSNILNGLSKQIMAKA